MALSLEVPAERMVRLFEQHGEDIFRSRWSLWGILRAPYTQSALRDLLADDALFGQRTLQACKHPVLVPAINYSTGNPVLFKTPHHPDLVRDWRYRLVDVALATSAAPGYFPRHSFDHCQYIDGGLFANAPGILAVHEAQHFLGCKRDQLHVVAVGTISSRFTHRRIRIEIAAGARWTGTEPCGYSQAIVWDCHLCTRITRAPPPATSPAGRAVPPYRRGSDRRACACGCLGQGRCERARSSAGLSDPASEGMARKTDVP
ncbi:CBASS cGAMP-activated phospholipase [Pseudoxanthomonas mexicana]